LPSSQKKVDWDDEEQAPLPGALWFNHQTGGAWLDALERHKVLCETHWVADFIRSYRPWSLNAWGAGLPDDADLSEFPTEWLTPFERLFLRTHIDLDIDTFEEEVISPLTSLPADSFFEATEIIVPSADSLFWDEKRMSIDHLVRLRTAVGGHLRGTHLWQWRKDENDRSMATTLRGVHPGLNGPIGLAPNTGRQR
jgi:hypothetical protein